MKYYRYYKCLDVATNYMQSYIADGFDCELTHIEPTHDGCEWLLIFS